MTRQLMEGCEAIAQAMVAAGCRFFSGYPMTPFTEVLEHMSRLLPTVDGVCMNADSEIEAIGMAWGATSTGTRTATGSVGQGLSLMQESLAEMSRARLPLVVLNMARGQGDYFQATRGGGHGDYTHIVLAPADVQEAVDLVGDAFNLADRWRTPVIVIGDYYLAHTQQAVEIPAIDNESHPSKPWALDGSTGGSGNARFLSPLTPNKRSDPEFVNHGGWLEALADVMDEIETGVEQRVDSFETEDAELVVVAFGTPARYLRAVVEELRIEGIPVGIIRPVTLSPFPAAAISAVANRVRGVAVFELNRGQMLVDVQLAVSGNCPVTFIGGVSFDRSGFGIAPVLEIETLKAKVRACFEQCHTAMESKSR